MQSPAGAAQAPPRAGGFQRSEIWMDTLVSIQIVGDPPRPDCAERVKRAYAWFERVEKTCSRFDAESELMRLSGHVGAATPVSPMLFECLRVALAVAASSQGAFDPTVGFALERLGFNQNYRDGHKHSSSIPPGGRVSFRDVRLDAARQTVTLRKPLVLDLGAVAKGMAIDLAAIELQPLRNFAIDAGGDLYVSGRNPQGNPWRIGIQHPRRPEHLGVCLIASDCAVCTSGDYERTAGRGGADHHIFDPRMGRSAGAVASVTVIAPSALLADALGTAAFVLGSKRGRSLLERSGVEGLVITAEQQAIATRGFCQFLA